MYIMGSAAAPTIGIACTTPGHPLDSNPEQQKMIALGTDVHPDPDAGEEGTNIKASKFRKILIIIIIIQNQNNSSTIQL